MVTEEDGWRQHHHHTAAAAARDERDPQPAHDIRRKSIIQLSTMDELLRYLFSRAGRIRLHRRGRRRRPTQLATEPQ